MNKAIEIRDFGYSYGDGTVALSGVNLDIDHGQKVVLVGPNGAGKTTLLLAMSGFVSGPGHVRVDGIEVKGKNTRQLRRVICSCLEDANDQLFMPTLFDDVAFGPLNMGLGAEQVKQAVETALRTVGLGKMATKAPHHLSAGQKRVAALATVLSMNPQIITFDEPDGSLDPRNRNKLVNILKGLKQTLVIATCNMNFAARVADRAVVIDAGMVAADGFVEEILSDRQLMEAHGLEVADLYC